MLYTSLVILTLALGPLPTAALIALKPKKTIHSKEWHREGGMARFFLPLISVSVVWSLGLIAVWFQISEETVAMAQLILIFSWGLALYAITSMFSKIHQQERIEKQTSELLPKLKNRLKTYKESRGNEVGPGADLLKVYYLKLCQFLFEKIDEGSFWYQGFKFDGFSYSVKKRGTDYTIKLRFEKNENEPEETYYVSHTSEGIFVSKYPPNQTISDYYALKYQPTVGTA